MFLLELTGSSFQLIKLRAACQGMRKCMKVKASTKGIEMGSEEQNHKTLPGMRNKQAYKRKRNSKVKKKLQ